MNILRKTRDFINNRLGISKPATPHIFFYKEARANDKGTPFYERWNPVDRILPLYKSDEVLDVGCAEGLTSLEIAPRVKSVNAFDVFPERIEKAQEFATQLGISNVHFQVASIVNHEIDREFDVVFFMSLIGIAADKNRLIGIPELEKCLKACRSLIVVRVNVQDDPKAVHLLQDIFETFEKYDFVGIAFPRMYGTDKILYDNIIIGVNRKSPRKLKSVYQLTINPIGHDIDNIFKDIVTIPYTQ